MNHKIIGLSPIWNLLPMLCLVLALTACNGKKSGGTPAKAEGLQQEDVIGNWRASSMKVSIASYADTKRDSSFSIDASKVSASSNRKAVLTVISGDGEYREETRTKSDSLVMENSGYWHLNHDTLIFRLKSVNAAEKRYHATRKGNRLMLKSALDFDGDMKKDDAITVVLEKE